MGNITFYIIVGIFFVASTGYGQKKIDKIIDGRDIQGIYIDTDKIFEIDIKTAKTTKISLKSGIDGETFETALIKAEIKNGTLQITSARSPYFKDIDDKLAAHKVLSVTLSLILPENMELWIDSSLAAVIIEGEFKLINLNLGRGDCKLTNFRGSGSINTLNGSIDVQTSNCQVNAESRHGIKKIENNHTGTSHLTLKSLTGDITVTQNQ